jgi:arylsulfatase A-like enzyme
MICSLMPAQAAVAAVASTARPNILIVVADDLGWADVSYHGSAIRTPHLDRLAREGVELDRHYVAPVCTPTRTALLTGRCWSRFGNTSPANPRVLPFDTVTLARALRGAGYETAIAGKWHLGSKPEWGPRKFGFDRSYGSLAGGVGPWNHQYKTGPYVETWHRDDALIEEEGHVTDLIVREAVRFIEAPRDRPFFLYLAFTAPHTPIEEPTQWLERARGIEEARRQYAASVMHMDDAVGQVVAALERTGRRERTLLLFFSDNGGQAEGNDNHLYPGQYPANDLLGQNTPLRGRKAQLFEGGIRTPALIQWPGTLRPGKVTAPLHVTDWMPTLSHLVGYRPPHDLKWDGRDIWSVVSGKEVAPGPRVLYWQGPGRRSAAIRDGDWKLIVERTGEGTTMLFDLARDPSEQNNLAEAHRDRVVAMQQLLAEQERRDNDAVVKDREGG